MEIGDSLECLASDRRFNRDSAELLDGIVESAPGCNTFCFGDLGAA